MKTFATMLLIALPGLICVGPAEACNYGNPGVGVPPQQLLLDPGVGYGSCGGGVPAQAIIQQAPVYAVGVQRAFVPLRSVGCGVGAVGVPLGGANINVNSFNTRGRFFGRGVGVPVGAGFAPGVGVPAVGGGLNVNVNSGNVGRRRLFRR